MDSCHRDSWHEGSGSGRLFPFRAPPDPSLFAPFDLITEQGDYFSLVATVMYVRRDLISYPSHGNGCLKKVLQDGGTWRCESCDVEVDEPEHRYLRSHLTSLSCRQQPPFVRRANIVLLSPLANRYLLSMLVLDLTGALWLTAFDEVGKVLLGTSANEFVHKQVRSDTS